MKTLSTASISNPDSLSGLRRNAYYNGMDCMLTAEIRRKKQSQFSPTTFTTYRFMFALQAPVLDMMLRGTPIDRVARDKMIVTLEARANKARTILNRFANALWGKDLNAGSWQQKGAFLYDFCRNEPIRKYDRASGTMKPTTNREALEKLLDRDIRIQPVINTILSYQDYRKALGILRSGIDSDGFMRSSYNIAGTETGRLASRQNAFGSGCLTGDHEVLTPDGWVSITEKPLIIMQVGLDGIQHSFVPSKWIEYKSRYRLIQVKTENIQFTVTKDHKILFHLPESPLMYSTAEVILGDCLRNSKPFTIFIPNGSGDLIQIPCSAITEVKGRGRMVYCPTVSSGYFLCRHSETKQEFATGNSNDQNWREEWRVIFAALPGPIPNRGQYNIPPEYRDLKPVKD